MNKLLLLLCLCGPCGAACSITITSPANNATVSGPTALTATTTGCPSAVRYEWKINGAPLPGSGTFEYSYTVPSCTAGACTGTYQMPSGFGLYNASYLWDGVWPLTVQVLDSAGTILATSSVVNMVVNDYGFGQCSFTAPASWTNLSGTITVTLHCPLTGTSGMWANGHYDFYLDGQELGSYGPTGYPDQSISIDTTTLENSAHLVWASVSGFSVPGNEQQPSGTPFAGVFQAFTTNNTNHFRELRNTFKTCYLWLGGTTTCSLSSRSVNDDNSESATNATFVSGTPAVATVGSCTSVANCTVTAVAQGASIITATDGSGHTATTRVVVQPGGPIAAHFGYDGSICMAYNSGNCAPNKSEILRGMFDNGSNTDVDPNLAHAMALNGFNVFEHGFYSSAQGFNLATWESVGQNPINNAVNAAMAAGPFKSFMGRCDSLGSTGTTLQFSADPVFPSRMAYVKSTLQGKVTNCVNGDEFSLPVIASFGTGQIGTATGPTQIVVSGTTATITWPNVTNIGYGMDITGATNSCFLHDGPNGDGTYIPVSGGSFGPYTFTTTCAPGTYKPSGGTFTETGAVLSVYNDLCQSGKSCPFYGPYNNTQLIGSGTGAPSYVQSNGSTMTIQFFAFDGTGPLQVDVASAGHTCLNGNNNNLTRTDVGTYTYPTSCASAVYGPAYNGETTATFHLHCNGSCSITGTLNQPIPNSILSTVWAQAHTFNPPIPMDLPYAGGAGTNFYSLAATVADYANIYFTRDGPESSGEKYGYMVGQLQRTQLLSFENHFWNAAWPGINQAQPWLTIIPANGIWYTRGGTTYTLGATTGSQFTTTVPNVAVVGAKVSVFGANCTANFNTNGGTGVAGDIVSLQSNTTFTISQSPGCTGSGGTVIIAPTNRYYTPPMDQVKSSGLRAIQIPTMWWDCIALGCAGGRAYNFGNSLTTSSSFNDYPAAASAAYAATFNTVPPNSPNNENNLTGLTYNVNDNPSNDARWKAIGITHALIKALEPEIIQPLCNAPDLGPRIHTGAKCGSSGKLVIAISDYEIPTTFNFPASLWSLYNTGAGPITRYQEISGTYVNVTTLAAGSTSDSHPAQGGEIDIWFFPSGSTPIAPTAVIGFNPASVGATQTAFRYSYICDPATFASNLDSQATRTIFTSATSITLDKSPGPICYDYLYLDSSNVPVGARSNVQVLH